MFASLWPHGRQNTRLPCLPLSPRICSSSCPLSQSCYLTTSTSTALFSSCPQSFPISGSFAMSQSFTSSGKGIEASAAASFISVNIQEWFPLGLTGLISMLFTGLSRVFSSTRIQKHQFFDTQVFFMVQLTHPYMITAKIIVSTIWTFIGKVMSLLSNTIVLNWRM